MQLLLTNDVYRKIEFYYQWESGHHRRQIICDQKGTVSRNTLSLYLRKKRGTDDPRRDSL